MAPKIEWPALSFISMRTVSPKRRKGVVGLPVAMRLDRAHFGDAGIADAALGDRLAGAAVELVGDGARADDRAGRKRAASSRHGRSGRGSRRSCRRPASARPKGLPLRSTARGRCSLPAVPGLAQLVRASRRPARRPRTAWTGRSRSPWRARPGSGPRKDTSLTSMTSRMRPPRVIAPAAHRHVADDHRDLGLQVDAPGLVGQRDRIRAGRGKRRSRPDTSADRSRSSPASRRRAPCAPARHGSHRPSRRPTDRRAAAATARRARGSARTARRRARGFRPARPDAARCGAQSSSAACRVGARKAASVKRVRSRETTTSRPSRVPSSRLASFMPSSSVDPRRSRPVAAWRAVEMLLQARPAVDVVVLQRFGLGSETRQHAADSASRT